jgi:hypothetical protein
VESRPGITDTHVRNRRMLQRAFFYGLNFFVLYMAISAPPAIRSVWGKTVYLDDARFLGPLLPHIQVTNAQFQFAFVPIALILYYPILYVSRFVAHTLALIGSQLGHITQNALASMHFFTFISMSVLVAAASEYAYSNRSLRESLGLAIGATLLIWVLMISSAPTRGR